MPSSVGVVGGGLAGLVSAFYLARALQKQGTPITIFESTDRTGGWIQSNPVNVEGGQIIFEAGPRSVRPKGLEGWLTLDLVRRLR
jgi:oxygen-dependent protoporphyrinogen oxidase